MEVIGRPTDTIPTFVRVVDDDLTTSRVLTDASLQVARSVRGFFSGSPEIETGVLAVNLTTDPAGAMDVKSVLVPIAAVRNAIGPDASEEDRRADVKRQIDFTKQSTAYDIATVVADAHDGTDAGKLWSLMLYHAILSHWCGRKPTDMETSRIEVNAIREQARERARGADDGDAT